MRRIFRAISLSLCVTLCLSACGRTVSPPAETDAPEPVSTPPATVVVYDVPGENGAAPTPALSADGLEGAYYNDYLRLTLTLDGAGGCVLRSETGDETGTYGSDAEGALSLRFGERTENASVDADGDITVEGRMGYFLRDWEKWGITEAEAGVAPAAEPRDEAEANRVDNGDGSFRYYDFDNGVALTCPEEMTVLTDRIVGGLAVRDGGNGCVTARNVTGIYSTHGGTDDEFLWDYKKNFVFADFALLYGALDSYDSFVPEHAEIEGRLAAVTLSLKNGSTASTVQAKVLLYTSTYADGTVNYICKTVFADPAEAGALDALEKAVHDVGAVRLVPVE